MPDGGVTEVLAWIGAELGGEIGATMIMYAPEIATAIQVTGAVYTLREQQRKAEARARDQFNAGLRDRYAMVRGATEARQLVLGRQRVSGPIAHIQSYGDNNSKVVFCVVLQADEADAIETIYLDDEPVVLDGTAVVGILRREEFSIAAPTGSFTITTKAKAGTVEAVASYGTTDVTLTVSVSGKTVSVSGAHSGETGLLSITYQPDPCPYALKKKVSGFFNTAPSGTGTDVVTLPDVPVAGSVVPVQSIFGRHVSLPASTSGSTVTVTGAASGTDIVVAYQAESTPSRVIVRSHLGAAGQTADAGMIDALDGVWTSAHTGTGLAYLVVELDYDADAFPSGIPNISAVIRGIKCYDPRDGVTRWTENPALLMRAYAIHPLGGRLSAGQIDDDSIIAAANICDQASAYSTVNPTWPGLRVHNHKLYTAGTVAKSGTRPSDVLNDLAQAMGGRWCMVDNKLRVVAGAYTSPVMPLTESWLHDGGAIQVQPSRARADVVNAITGTFADSTKHYKVLNYPKVTADAYVAADGKELPTDIAMPAVTWSGQAQYIAACQLRYSRQGLTVKLSCNMRAYQCEPFDVISVTLPRFGWSAKPFEVLDAAFSLDGGIDLSLKEIDPSIWDMDASFLDSDPAPNTLLPSPWDLPDVEGLALDGGTAGLLLQADGTIMSRILATWDAQTDPRIAQDGQIELRWGQPGDTDAEWQRMLVAGGSTQAYLTGVKEGRVYLVKARTVGALAGGPWCVQVSELVEGKSEPPSTPTGLTAAIVKGVITWTWDACQDVDYDNTEVRPVDLGWGGIAPEADFKGLANGWQEVTNTTGDITRYIRHFDTSGNYSSAADSYTITVTSADLPPGDVVALTATPETIQIAVDGTTGLAADFSAAISTLAVMVGPVNDIAAWTLNKVDTGVVSTLSGTDDETLTITGYDPALVNPDFGMVVLQTHLAGAATDSSRYKRAPTVGGSVTWGTTGAPVGSGYATFTGAASAASNIGFSSAGFLVPAGPFCIEGRVRFSALPTAGSPVAFLFGSARQNVQANYSAGSVKFSVGTCGATIGPVGPALTTGQWYAIAWARDASNVIRVILDGVIIGSSTLSTDDSSSTFASWRRFDIGSPLSSSGYPGITGDVCEVRFTIGTPVRTGAYTVDTQPFPDGAYLPLGYVDVTATKGADTATKRVQVISTTGGAAAVTAKLSQTTWSAAATAAGVVSSFSGSATTMTVSVGGVDDSASWAYSYVTSNAAITASLSTNTLTITAFGSAVDSGWVEITATRAGYAPQTIRYPLSKIKAADVLEVRTSQATIYVHGYSSNGHVPSYTGASSTLAVIRNGTDETGSWTVTINSSANWSASVASATVTLTALDDATDTDTIIATLTRAGYPTMVKAIGIAKVRDLVLGAINLIGQQIATNPVGGGVTICSLTLQTNGHVTLDNGVFAYDSGSWYAPPATGIGASYWVRVSVVNTTFWPPAYSGPALGTWVSLASAQTLYCENTGGAGFWVGRIEIATSSGGAGATTIGTVTFDWFSYDGP